MGIYFSISSNVRVYWKSTNSSGSKTIIGCEWMLGQVLFLSWAHRHRFEGLPRWFGGQMSVHVWHAWHYLLQFSAFVHRLNYPNNNTEKWVIQDWLFKQDFFHVTNLPLRMPVAGAKAFLMLLCWYSRNTSPVCLNNSLGSIMIFQPRRIASKWQICHLGCLWREQKQH